MLSNEFSVDLITTNDVHGFISQQNAYFMNPQFPPTIIGGAGFYEYVSKNTNHSKSLIFDAGNFFMTTDTARYFFLIFQVFLYSPSF